jgi:hypothetical protein
MTVLPVPIKHALDAAVQRSHDPMRAIIVGPPKSATNIKASIAACHSGSAASFFGSPVMLGACVLQRDELATARQGDRFVERAASGRG